VGVGDVACRGSATAQQHGPVCMWAQLQSDFTLLSGSAFVPLPAGGTQQVSRWHSRAGHHSCSRQQYYTASISATGLFGYFVCCNNTQAETQPCTLRLLQCSIHQHTGCSPARHLLAQAMRLLLPALRPLMLLRTARQVGDDAVLHPCHSLQVFTAPALAGQSACRCC
jgi:hypothetical protein